MPAKGWKGYKSNTDLIAAKVALSGVDPKMKGSIAESYVALRLAELGFDIWMPYMNNHKADLAVLVRQRLVRIQVKSATFDLRHERFRAILTTRDREGKHVKYQPDSQDFFIIKPEGLFVFYVIPSAVGIAHHSLNVYPHRERVFAKEFNAEIYKDAFHLLRQC